jgi:hypothetical protein
MSKVRLGTLKYDTVKEEGVVQIDWVLMSGDVVMLDILKDWAYELMRIYEEKVKEVYK